MGADQQPTIDAAAIAAAAARLDAGELVAFATETVYGLGADARNPDAVRRIYAAKGRPADHPVIVHLAPGADVRQWAAHVPPVAQDLIDAFWPGPLTLILPRAAHIDATVSAGQDSIGLRCPSHPVAQALLTAFAQRHPGEPCGVAAPSANRFGQVSPSQASHVIAEFPAEVAAGMPVLDGGPSDKGIESTIVDVSRVHLGVPPTLLRPGSITAEQLAAVIGAEPARPDAAAPRASGTLKAHYAPHTPLELADAARLAAVCAGEGLPVRGQTVVLAYGARPAQLSDAVVWHGLPDDPNRYAHALYATLRDWDTRGMARLVVQAPPATSAWAAVNDRIHRAAAAFALDTDGLGH